MKKNYLLYIFLVCVYGMHTSVAVAQDPHFSQYFNSPMSLNPALIGKGIGDFRVLGTFRSQWWGASISPYNTRTASIEKAFRSGGTGKSVFGIGFSILSDASNSGLLKNNYFTVGAAYNISLDGKGNEFLGVGLEGTYANRLLDASKFEFQSQFGSMGFQRSAPSGDPVSITSNQYFDVNMGVHYSKRYKSGGLNLGVAVYHASTPKQGVLSNTNYSVDRRVSLQAGMIFNLTNEDQVHISSNTDFQGENSIHSLGGVYKVRLNDKIESLNIGLWSRFRDALYPYIALEGKSWLFGITYDVINSEIRNSYTSVQSMEISFGWLFGAKRNPVTRPENMLIY